MCDEQLVELVAMTSPRLGGDEPRVGRDLVEPDGAAEVDPLLVVGDADEELAVGGHEDLVLRRRIGHGAIMPTQAVESRARDDNRAMRRGELTKRWSPTRAGIVVALCLFAALGWQGVTTVGQIGGDDSGEHLAYAQYLDAHHRIPGKAVNYEFSTPPLFQITAVAAERIVRHLPSVRVELPWNPATRGLWLLLVAGGAFALTTARRGARRAGVAALGLAALWALDEAISLSRSEPWTVGQLIALACGGGLLLVTGLIGARGLARQAAPRARRRRVRRRLPGRLPDERPLPSRDAVRAALRARRAHLPEGLAARMAAPAGLVARRGVRRGGPDPAAGGRGDRLPRRSRALPRSPPGRRLPRARRDRDAAPRRTLVGVRDAPLAQPAAVEPRAAEVADAGSPAALVLRLVPAADARRPPVRARLLERALPEAARRALERLVPA